MPWLTQPREPTLAELFGNGSISGGGGISSGLLRPPPNQWEEALAKVLPAIKDYIQKKKSDEIANQLQNMYQPPRAEAVDPRMQGLPATMPFTGGADQFQVAEMYRKTQEAAEDRELNRRHKEAQINRKGEFGSSGYPRYPVTLPDGRTILVTGNQALEQYEGTTKRGRGDSEKWKESIAIARGKLDQKGEFTNQYPEAAEGDMVQLRTPDGKTIVVPWAAYQERTQTQNPAAENYKGVQQQTPRAEWKESPSEDFRPNTSYDVPVAPSDPTKREKGKVYSTPRGNLKWTGTGWLSS